MDEGTRWERRCRANALALTGVVSTGAAAGVLAWVATSWWLGRTILVEREKYMVEVEIAAGVVLWGVLAVWTSLHLRAAARANGLQDPDDRCAARALGCFGAVGLLLFWLVLPEARVLVGWCAVALVAVEMVLAGRRTLLVRGRPAPQPRL